MKIIRDHYQNIHNLNPLTLAIGNFDGLHLGHQKIIETVMGFSDTSHAIMSFSPHPNQVLRNQVMYYLTNESQKEAMLQQFGIDLFIELKFDHDFASLSVMAFIEFLKAINVKRLVIGRDFKFAHQGQGRLADLTKHFEVKVLEDTFFNELKVSSTLIRTKLKEGEVEAASKLLGRNYVIEGRVMHGDKVGRTLGFPTANIGYDHYFLPKVGIYYVNVYINQQKYLGVCNVGHNPTINFSKERRVEVFIIDFNQSLYELGVKIEFITYLRAEIKFESKDALIEQIENDVKKVLSLAKIK